MDFLIMHNILAPSETSEQHILNKIKSISIDSKDQLDYANVDF